MRKTLAATVLVVLASLVACSDMATAPTAETPDPSLAPTAKVLSGVDALVRFKASLDRELADVRALELNARATGLTVEQRRAEVGRLLAQFDEFMAVEPAAPLLQASSRCSQTALFTAVAISIAVEDEPIFPGLARAATVWGYSWSNTTARHRIYVFAETGGQWIGGPDYSNPAAEADATSTQCVRSFAVGTPTFLVHEDWNGCWYVYGESMHRIVKTGRDEELYRTKLKQGGPCDGRR